MSAPLGGAFVLDETFGGSFVDGLAATFWLLSRSSPEDRGGDFFRPVCGSGDIKLDTLYCTPSIDSRPSLSPASGSDDNDGVGGIV